MPRAKVWCPGPATLRLERLRARSPATTARQVADPVHARPARGRTAADPGARGRDHRAAGQHAHRVGTRPPDRSTPVTGTLLGRFIAAASRTRAPSPRPDRRHARAAVARSPTRCVPAARRRRASRSTAPPACWTRPMSATAPHARPPRATRAAVRLRDAGRADRHDDPHLHRHAARRRCTTAYPMIGVVGDVALPGGLAGRHHREPPREVTYSRTGGCHDPRRPHHDRRRRGRVRARRRAGRARRCAPDALHACPLRRPSTSSPITATWRVDRGLRRGERFGFEMRLVHPSFAVPNSAAHHAADDFAGYHCSLHLHARAHASSARAGRCALTFRPGAGLDGPTLADLVPGDRPHPARPLPVPGQHEHQPDARPCARCRSRSAPGETIPFPRPPVKVTLLAGSTVTATAAGRPDRSTPVTGVLREGSWTPRSPRSSRARTSTWPGSPAA